MTDKRRLNLSLSMASPRHREVWRVLRDIPAGRRTDAVCRMILEHRSQTELLKAVRAVVREELDHLHWAPTIEPSKPSKAEDIDESVLGFLQSLQEGDDMT